MIFVFGIDFRGLNPSFLDEQGQHLGSPRRTTVIDGRRHTLESCFLDFIPPPPELLEDLPYAVSVLNAKGSIGYAAPFGCYLMTQEALDLIRLVEPSITSSYKAPRVFNDEGKRINLDLFFVPFPRISRQAQAVDIETSNVYWKDFKLSTGKVQKTLLTRTDAPLKIIMQPEMVNKLNIWRGAGLYFSELDFCRDIFARTWQDRVLTGLKFVQCSSE